MTNKTQVLLGTFMLGMFVITKGYSGLLISSLTKPQMLKKMDTIEDVLKSDSEIIFIPGTGTYNRFVSSSDPIDLQILEKYQNQKTIVIPKVGDFSHIVNNEKTVIFSSGKSMQYQIRVRYTTPSGHLKVYIGKQEIQGPGGGYAFQKGSPLEDEMSKQ
jgi:hypothetical protein